MNPEEIIKKILEEMVVLENRVKYLEEKLGFDKPVTNSMFEEPDPDTKCPTNALVGHWMQHRAKKGLGVDSRMSRHAAAFKTLWKLSKENVAIAKKAMDLFFADSRHWVIEKGWSIDLFQKMMDGCVYEAIRKAPHFVTAPLPPASPAQKPLPPVEEAAPKQSVDDLVKKLKSRVLKNR